jgi:beta-lactamase superfamily II metal-dependent hydrolase
VFQIEMLPAREGDCMLLTYGRTGALSRVLIDGGRAGTRSALKKRFKRLAEEERELELLVVTHVDRDHIEGILSLLEDKSNPVRFREIWFNGYDHLRNLDVESFGPVQGERLTRAILEQRIPWNGKFQGMPIEAAERCPVRQLDGGLTLTVLSPDRAKLEALIPRWESQCRNEGLVPGVEARRREIPEGMEPFGPVAIEELARAPFEPDDSLSNGTSIALLAEYEGKRVLLAGDAHPDLLEASLRNLLGPAGGRVPVDAMKVSHHGSSYNTSREVLDLLSCPMFLISTNGSIYHHPEQKAMARLIRSSEREKQIVFNYRSDETLIWNNPRWQTKFGYQTRYPEISDNGSAVITI